MYMADDHDSCPRECVLCGERLASVRCVECGGNGSKAFPPDYGVVECEQCGGVGFAHEGCAEMSYADLFDELTEIREKLHHADEYRARIDAAISNHPDPGPCDTAAEGTTCGWKLAYQDILKARTDR